MVVLAGIGQDVVGCWWRGEVLVLPCLCTVTSVGFCLLCAPLGYWRLVYLSGIIAGMDDLSGHMQSEDNTARLDEQRDRLLAPGVGRVQTGSSTEDAQADTRSAGSVASTRKKTAADDAFPSRRLKRFPLVVYLACAYTVVALFAWSIICVLVYRPVTTRHYGRHARS